MKKRITALFMATILIFAFTSCGNKKDNNNDNKANTSNTENSSDTTDSTGNINTAGEQDVSGDITKISNEEITSLADNEFFAANSTGIGIKELYVSKSGSGDWGNSLISSTINNGTKVKISLNDLVPDEMYDICVVDEKSGTTEYYSFNIKSTVQIVFYSDAQCDVITI